MPDIPNWAWHEYGNRPVLADAECSTTSHPCGARDQGLGDPAILPICRAAVEFIGHGFTQQSMQKVADERDDIRKTAAAIGEFTGKHPRGWLGPGLTETWETPDLLVEEGFEYLCDWVLDDQPVVLKTGTTPIVNLPYSRNATPWR
jgi:peptidoglycan/xylan/chitin deacetylase (PgdA/CDA1 family)